MPTIFREKGYRFYSYDLREANGMDTNASSMTLAELKQRYGIK